jgi:hypothetical protein
MHQKLKGLFVKLIETKELNKWLRSLLGRGTKGIPKQPVYERHTPSLERQHQELVNALAPHNKHQDNPLQVPIGFHKVVGDGGASLGFGFYCPKCKLHVPADAPLRVRHCGTFTTRPTGKLAVLKMSKYKAGVFYI